MSKKLKNDACNRHGETMDPNPEWINIAAITTDQESELFASESFAAVQWFCLEGEGLSVFILKES